MIDHLACRSALLTHLTGRPVKFAYTREQSIIESCKRHPYKMKYKVGLDEVGHIVAMKVDILADSGGYAASSPFVTGGLRYRPRVLIVFLMSILM